MANLIGSAEVDINVDVSKLKKGMKDAENITKSSVDRLKIGFDKLDISAAALGASVAAGGAAFAAFSIKVMDTANEIKNLSQTANTSASEFQKMAAASQTVGIQQDKLSDILKDVNDKTGDFLSTGGGEMKDFFENIAPKVGVTAEQFKNLSGKDALQLYYTSLEKANLNQQEMTFYMESLADDSTKLIPLLANNGAEMKRLGDAAQASGRIMSNEMIAKLPMAKQALDNLTGSLTGMATVATGDVIVAIYEMANELTPLWAEMSKTGEVINSNLEPALNNLSNALGLATVDGNQLADNFRANIAPSLTVVAQDLATVINALAAISNALKTANNWLNEHGIKLNFVTDAIQKTLNPFAQLHTSINTIKSGVQLADTAIKSIINTFNQVAIAASNLSARFQAVGRDIANGLSQGMEQGKGSLIAKAREIGGAVENAVRSRLDTHSPSKVMEKVGADTVAGLEKGLVDNLPYVQAAAFGLSQAILDIDKQLNNDNLSKGQKSSLEELKDSAQNLHKELSSLFTEQEQNAQKYSDSLNILVDGWNDGRLTVEAFNQALQRLNNEQAKLGGQTYTFGDVVAGQAINKTSDRVEATPQIRDFAKDEINVWQDTLAIYKSLISEQQKAADEFQQKIDTLQAAQESGYITMQEYYDMYDKLYKQRQEELLKSDTLRAKFSETFADAMKEGLVSGDWDTVLKSKLNSVLNNFLTKILTNAGNQIYDFIKLSVSSSSNSGFSLSSVGSVIGKIFGGFRANGGTVEAGKSYIVGERGYELFTPTQDGVIHNQSQLAGIAANKSAPQMAVINVSLGNELLDSRVVTIAGQTAIAVTSANNAATATANKNSGYYG